MKISLSLLLRLISFLSVGARYDDEVSPNHPDRVKYQLLLDLKKEMESSIQ